MGSLAQAAILPTDLESKVGADYQPVGSEERAIWQNLERVEEAIRTSPQRLIAPELDAYTRGVVERLIGRPAPDLRIYRLAIRAPMDLFAGLRAPLEDIKELAGSPPGSLAMLQRSASRIATLMAAVVPPEEVTAAHALLLSAVQLAGNAAQIRREAALAGDMARAWDASSAAAGALMLGAKARTDILAALRLPQLGSP